MKKALLGMAVLATFSASSYAQSTTNVQFYGLVDNGVVFSKNGAPGTGTLAAVSSGTVAGSFFGFRGSEDLGGGLKAVFRLEAGFSADTGAAKNYAGNYNAATPTATGGASIAGLFNKRSLVGLETPYGTVTMGRDYTPLYWAGLDTDVMHYGMYGNLQQTLVLSSTGADRYGQASNEIEYESPQYAGLKGRFMYSMGSESPGTNGAPSATTAPKNANRLLALSLNYTLGGLYIASAYQQLALPLVSGTTTKVFTGSNGTVQDFLLGGRYVFNGYSLGTGFFKIKQPMAHTNGGDIYVGGTVNLGPGTLMAEVSRMRQDTVAGGQAHATILGVGYLYPLSKRTQLFATYGQSNNSSGGQFSLVAADGSLTPGALGATVKAMAFGINHKF